MSPERKLTLGVILPHTKIFGGVKRFFEIGNILVAQGHVFIVFTPDGARPDWFPFQGEVLPLEKISSFSFDALFITEPRFLPELEGARTSLRVFYAVLQRRYIRRVARRKDLVVLANSESLYRYLEGEKRDNIFRCVGGIDTQKFQFQPRPARKPGEPFVVLVYGRFYRKKKGTLHVVRACEALHRRGYNIKLLLFDTPVDEEARKKVENFTCKVPFRFFVDYPVENLADLYHQADVFVSAERNAGWSNTSAEAMACGVPVIATTSGTEDFLVHEQTGLVVWRHSWFIRRALKRLHDDDALRATLALNARKKIGEFSWDSVADIVKSIVMGKLPPE